ncbi:MAG: hypothetical protein ACYT04_63670, partial [Nostoc sp.]
EKGKQRTDSTHVLAAIRNLNRLESVAETLRAALNFAWFKIERHILIKGKSLPDDPKLRDYWINRANASKVLLITTKIKTQRKISISGSIYFPRLKAIAKIFVNKQELVRLFLTLLRID